jgi:Amt family ammonium transporter
MIGGAWGVIATGLLSKPDLMDRAFGLGDHAGWFYEWAAGSGDFTLIGIQLLGVLLIMGWTGVTMGVFFSVLNFVGLFRVDALEEEVGLDISVHKGPAYDTSGAANDAKVSELDASRGKDEKKSSDEKEGDKSSDEKEAS